MKIKILRFTGDILKDLFFNIYHLILSLLLLVLFLGLATLILLLGLLIISIIPKILSSLGYNMMASVVMVVEIVIAFLFLIEINIFKLPNNIIRYLKRKWNEIE